MTESFNSRNQRRVRLDRNPLRIFDCKVDGDKDFVRAAPSIADHLCEPCATHFAAVQRQEIDR